MRVRKVSRVVFVVCIIVSAMAFHACGRKLSSGMPAENGKLGLHTTAAQGEKKYIVVIIDFPDVKRKYPQRAISDRLIGFLPPYFRAASYDKLVLKGEMTKMYTLPRPASYYRISPRNLEVDRSRVMALVTDAANAADSDVRFDDYDYVILALGATPAEYGMVGLCPIPGMLGFEIKSITNKSGEIINRAAVFTESAHLGTYVHDSLHMIGGRVGKLRLTPCLYDHELQARYPHYPESANALINLGYWDPLSSHAPHKFELPPTGLSSWTKMRLNWIDPTRIALVSAGQTATVKLDPLSDRHAATLAIKIPITHRTYYLVENRQKIDSDANCPTTGVLVLYADDSIPECHQGKAPVRIMDANPSVPYMNDAAFDIGKKDRYIDRKNNIAIVLQRKEGLSYQIQVTTADHAK